jgi:4-hydroxybenzoate polyprenyltransferase/phosphoserine phosphatase
MNADTGIKPPDLIVADVAVRSSGKSLLETVPLVVDLDGTLLRSDVLAESLFVLARNTPLNVLKVPAWIGAGRAAFKQRVAHSAMPDIHTLPYRGDVLNYLQEQKQQGRRLILATAADMAVAKRVAAELGIFDAVYASDGQTNLSGEHKAARLVALFGTRGFDYIGNSPRDLAVWRVARTALIVSSSARLRRAVEATTPVERVFSDDSGGPSAYVLALRPHQWVKNLLVFLPLLAAHHLYAMDSLPHAALAFLAFTLCASSVYLLNDLLDLPADRSHPHKRNRVLASGRVGVLSASVLMALLIASALALGLFLHPLVMAVLGFYFMSNVAYSLGLKDLPILDVLILASGYAARVAVGAIAVSIHISPWLLAFCIFLFFSLALIKRYAELTLLRARDGAKTHARGYLLDDMGVIAAQGVGAGYIAVLVLALYTTTPMMHDQPVRSPLYWLLCLLLLYWVSYLWLMADRGCIHDDPVAYALRDRTSQVLMIAATAAALAAT